jgi:hypothetical protein
MDADRPNLARRSDSALSIGNGEVGGDALCGHQRAAQL